MSNSNKGDEKKSSLLNQIIPAVVIALVAGGTAPWWFQLIRPTPTLPPSSSTTPTPSSSTTLTPSPPNLDINGTWRDSNGAVYQITQRGNTFEFTATNPTTGVSSRGSGTINGQDFESVFTTSLPSSGRGGGKVSADGKQMTGTFYDTSIGQYTWTIYR